MFFDEQGVLNVYMLQTDDELTPEASEPRGARLETALSAVFGEEIFAPGPPARINIVKGDYDISQLTEWKSAVDRALALPGTVFTDLDEILDRWRLVAPIRCSRL